MSFHYRRSPITHLDQVKYYKEESDIMENYKISPRSRRHTVAFTKRYLSDDSELSEDVLESIKSVKTSPPPEWHRLATRTVVMDTVSGFTVKNDQDELVVRTIPIGKKTLVQFNGGDMFNLALLSEIDSVSSVGDDSSIYSDTTRKVVYIKFDDQTSRCIKECTLEMFGCALDRIHTGTGLNYDTITKLPDIPSLSLKKKKLPPVKKRPSIWKRPFQK